MSATVISVDKMTLEQLLERKERLEKSALRAIELEKDGLFDTVATRLEPVYARIEELQQTSV